MRSKRPIRSPLVLVIAVLTAVPMLVVAGRPAAGQDASPTQGAIGDLVWFDDNDNGRVDDGERGVGGVRVELIRQVDGEDPGSAVQVTTTDSGGFYRFSSVDPGTYFIVLPSSNWSSGPLAECVSSTPTSTDPRDLVDSDDNGTTSVGGIVAGPIVVEGLDDSTVDLGCHRPDARLDFAASVAAPDMVQPGRVAPISIELENTGSVRLDELVLAAEMAGSIELADKNWDSIEGSARLPVVDGLDPGERLAVMLHVRVPAAVLSSDEVVVSVLEAVTALHQPGGVKLTASIPPPVIISLGGTVQDEPEAIVQSVESSVVTATPDPPAAAPVPTLALTGTRVSESLVFAVILILGGVSLVGASERGRNQPEEIVAVAGELDRPQS